ncbi:MAG: GDCCVxC domain-containing (seleno)protein [Bacteroidota bacterium]
MILLSLITCPVCGFQKMETMPRDACIHFYECESCKKILKPKDGDCCVFCSYGSIVCSSKQTES